MCLNPHFLIFCSSGLPTVLGMEMTDEVTTAVLHCLLALKDKVTVIFKGVEEHQNFFFFLEFLFFIALTGT